MLSDPYPELDVVSPRELGGTPVTLHLVVPDVDAVYARAAEHGGRAAGEPEDKSYGARSFTLLDPFGHRWMVQTPVGSPTIEQVQAETTGYTITTPRSPRARRDPVPVGQRCGGFEHEDRDDPGGPLLVLGVVGVGGHGALPPLRPLVAGGLAGDHVHPDRTVLQLDVRVGDEVVVPDRVLGRTSQRRHRGVAPVVLDPHHRGLAQLAGLVPAGRHDDHRHAAERRALGPAGRLVLIDLVPHPLHRVRFVFTIERHGFNHRSRLTASSAAAASCSVPALIRASSSAPTSSALAIAPCRKRAYTPSPITASRHDWNAT